MSEQAQTGQTAAAAAAAAAAPKAQGPGARLAEARLRQGLHIATLAAQLKVAPERLQALEAERWDALPDPTHARALATSVCRVLGLDPVPVLAGMPRGAGAGLERVSAGLNQPVRSGGALRSPGLRWALLAAAGLVALALALAFVPERGLRDMVQGLQAVTQAASAPGDEAQAAANLPSPVAQAVEPVVLAQPVASAPAAAASPAASAAPSSPTQNLASGAPLLQLRAPRGASWVSVIDAGGNTLASRLLAEGETLELPAGEIPRLPLRVTLGNAPAVDLQWRGQPQPLAGYEQRRVAKLELS